MKPNIGVHYQSMIILRAALKAQRLLSTPETKPERREYWGPSELTRGPAFYHFKLAAAVHCMVAVATSQAARGISVSVFCRTK